MHVPTELAFPVPASIYVMCAYSSVVTSVMHKVKGGIHINIRFVFTVTLTMKLETDNHFVKTILPYSVAVYYCLIW